MEKTIEKIRNWLNFKENKLLFLGKFYKNWGKQFIWMTIALDSNKH